MEGIKEYMNSTKQPQDVLIIILEEFYLDTIGDLAKYYRKFYVPSKLFMSDKFYHDILINF